MRAHRFWRDQFHAYRMWILERELPRVPDPMPAIPVGIELRMLDRHARRDWVCQRGDASDWPQYRVALEHGHDLVLALRDGQTIGWAWLGTERVYLPPLGRDIRLTAGTGYLYDAYVRPAERGRGVGRALVAARCARATELGLQRLVSHVLVGNQVSLHSLQTQHFELVGRTLFLRALALRWWTREPLPARPAA
jgi:GNAT superfamily N-acetyltransferase